MDPKEALVVLLCKHMVFSFEPSDDNLKTLLWSKVCKTKLFKHKKVVAQFVWDLCQRMYLLQRLKGMELNLQSMEIHDKHVQQHHPPNQT